MSREPDSIYQYSFAIDLLLFFILCFFSGEKETEQFLLLSPHQQMLQRFPQIKVWRRRGPERELELHVRVKSSQVKNTTTAAEM